MADAGGREHARVRLIRRPLWIWLIPLAAVGVGGWIVARSLLFGNASVVVHASDAGGLDQGASVLYRGVKVGTVTEVGIGKGARPIDLHLSIDPSVGNLLRTGTKFWVVEAQLGSGGVKALVSGGHVAMEAGPGEPANEFDALERPPVLPAPGPGRGFVVHAAEAGSLGIGSTVRFRGVVVGKVQGVELEGDGVAIHVFVPEPDDQLVREGTRFWRGGGVSLRRSGGLGLDLPPMDALLRGSLDFDAPSVLAGPPAEANTAFSLYPSRAAAEAAMAGAQLPYVVRFAGAVDGLQPGAPVDLLGIRVGRVSDVRLRPIVGNDVTPSTTVVLELDAQRLGVTVTPQTTRDELRARLDDTLQRLVAEGLRAHVTGGLLPGSAGVSLAMVADAEPARLSDGEPPVLPTGGGGSLTSAMSVIGEEVPNIAERVRSITGHIDQLLGGRVRQGHDVVGLIEELERAAIAVRELASYLTRHPEAVLTGKDGSR